MPPSQRLARPSRITRRDRERRAAHRRDLDRAGTRAEARGRRGPRAARSRARRTPRPVTTTRPRSRPRAPECPRWAVTIAPPCSAAFPTSATITAATKNCDSPSRSPNSVIDPTSASETKAVATVATVSAVSGGAEAPGGVRRLRLERGAVLRAGSASSSRRRGSGAAQRPAASAGRGCGDPHRRASRGSRGSGRGTRRSPSRRSGGASDRRSTRAAAAVDDRDPEDDQRRPDDRARDRAADDVRQPVADREHADDQLGRVPEARVEEAADSRARCARRGSRSPRRSGTRAG